LTQVSPLDDNASTTSLSEIHHTLKYPPSESNVSSKSSFDMKKCCVGNGVPNICLGFCTKETTSSRSAFTGLCELKLSKIIACREEIEAQGGNPNKISG
jgi:hypothetical protein